LRTRIEEAFELAAKDGRKALIGFLTAGDPTPSHTGTLCRALIEGGVDVLELGIPFSDPIADGPTIQAANNRALAAGTTTDTCLELASNLRREYETPIVFLTYYNPIFRYGLANFMKKISECVDGLVVPDLPEFGSKDYLSYKHLAKKNHLATILLAAPTTTNARLKSLMRESAGFLYLVSLLGVTGARSGVPSASLDLIRRVARTSNGSVRVAVGFGISSPEQVSSVLRTGADGVIVGSAFVNIVANNLQNIEAAASQLRDFASKLREATRI
jgi:tryptophan synthase alpha chain